MAHTKKKIGLIGGGQIGGNLATNAGGQTTTSVVNDFNWTQLAGSQGRLTVTTQVEDNDIQGGHAFNIRHGSIAYRSPGIDVSLLDSIFSILGPEAAIHRLSRRVRKRVAKHPDSLLAAPAVDEVEIARHPQFANQYFDQQALFHLPAHAHPGNDSDAHIQLDESFDAFDRR